MKSLVFLEYTFIFEPENPWGRLRDFEVDFAKFLRSINIEGEFIHSVDGQPGRRIIYLRKSDDNLDKWRGSMNVKEMGKEIIKGVKPKR